MKQLPGKGRVRLTMDFPGEVSEESIYKTERPTYERIAGDDRRQLPPLTKSMKRKEW